MRTVSEFSGKVAFAVGTGRCGTQFLSRVLQQESTVVSSHERNPLNESFHRYCQWYCLPVDHAGFLSAKEKEIRQDLHRKPFSFEASAFLSLSLQELYHHFDAKFIFMVRRPDQVINSFLSKNWYAEPVVWEDKNKVPGYQDLAKEHHFFSRLVPHGNEYSRWENMSRIGKLGWFWNVINMAIAEQLKCIPESNWRIVKLEELDHQTYQTLLDFLGIKSTLSESNYQALVKERPNRRRHVLAVSDWSLNQIAEFQSQVKPAAEYLGYEFQVNKLSPVLEQTAQRPIFMRPRKVGQLITKKLRSNFLPPK